MTDRALTDRRLTDADVEAVALRVVDILDARTGADRRLVSAQVLAKMFDLDPRWVRAHGHKLGGRRMGDGPRARWRFDPVEARHHLDAWRVVAEKRPAATAQPRSVGGFPPIDGPRARKRAA